MSEPTIHSMVMPHALAKMVIPASRLPALLLLAILAGAGAFGGVHAGAQGEGSYALTGTWHGLRDAIPADAWRQPAGIAIDDARRIYVSDAAAGRITVIEPDGSARKVVTESAGLLAAPTHLAVDSERERIFVADPGLGALVVLGLDGRLLRRHAGIAGPAGVGVAPDGTVYVGSADTGLVHAFTAAGEALPPFSGIGPIEAGTGFGDLLGGLDVDADGQVVVLDGRDVKVRIFDASGDLLDTFKPPELVADVAVDYAPSLSSRRRYWFATENGVLRYDPQRGYWENRPGAPVAALDVDSWVGTAMAIPAYQGRYSEVHLLPYAALRGDTLQRWGGPIMVPGILDGPQGIEAGADGRLYVLDLGPRIQRFAEDGRVIDQVPHAEAWDADADAAGTLYALDARGVRAFPPPAGEEGTPGPGGAPRAPWRVDMLNPVALAVAPPSARGAEALFVLSADGVVAELALADGARGDGMRLAAPPDERVHWSDLAVDAAGWLYALDRRTPSLTIVAPDGTQANHRLPRRGRRIAATGDGHVLMLDRDGWVRRFTREGRAAGAFDATRFDASVASAPADLGVDAGGLVYVADRKAGLISLYAWDDSATPQAPPDDATTCRSYSDKTAAPPEIWIGETVEVALRVRGGCGRDVLTQPLDVVLIVDESGSMGGKVETVRRAAMDFVDEMDLGVSQVGIVAFNNRARLVSPLVQDEGRLRRAIQRLGAQGGTNIAIGLQHGRQEMRLRGRPEEAKPIFVLLSDGYNNAGRAPVVAEARRAKADGIEIFTIGIGADEVLMKQVASGEDHYFAASGTGTLFDIFDAIAQEIATSLLFRAIVVTDRIPGNMRYLPASANPSATYDPQSHSLSWTLTNIPFNGFGLRYRLEPLELGLWPTNVVAWGEGRDGYGAPARVDFPVPVVRVIGPTATPTPSATPTPTPSPSITPSPTPTPGPIYLPLLLRERCAPDERHADVVLLMDTSSSMTGAKLAAAQAAAKRFLATMGLDPSRPADDPGSQVAIVSFDAEARLELALGNDPSVLAAAIDALRTRQGTYIDRGLAAAAEALAGPRRAPSHTPVIVLLTDGLQTGDPAGAYDAARRIREAGTLIYAVGLGSDVDRAFLEIVCEHPDRFYHALLPEDLVAIYDRIAGRIPCAPDSFWGRRVR